MKKFRDVIILDEINLIVTTDSAAGIGEKEFDSVHADVETVAYYAAFVPLVEALAVRSKPFLLIDTLCNERFPYGEKIITGIKKAMFDAKMDLSNGFTGSTEENFVTKMTGIGVTVLSKGFEMRKAKKGDAIFAIGKGLVGEELLREINSAMTIDDYFYLKSLDFINDIVPLGSKGAMHEINEIENHSLLKARIVNDDFDYLSSAGPATMCLITTPEENIHKLNIKRDVNLLAYME